MAVVAAVAPAAVAEEDSAVVAGCKVAADLAVVARNAAAPVDSGAVVSEQAEQAEQACNVVARADSARAGLLPAADLAAAFPPISPRAKCNAVALPWAPTATKVQLGVADLTAALLADWVFAQAPVQAARAEQTVGSGSDQVPAQAARAAQPVGSGLVPASVQEGQEGPPVELESAQVLAQEARADRPAE